MREKVTISDIAGLTGVSESTVSRILNNKGKYAEETREAVRRAAEKLNYKKSFSEPLPRCENRKLIGIVIPSVEHEFFGSFAQRIAREIYEKDYIPFLCITGEDPSKEDSCEQLLRDIGAAGAIMMMRETDLNPACLDIPSVFIGSIPENAKGDCVLFDIVDGGKQATEELLRAGCRRIVYLSSDRHRMRHMGRFLGYQQALWEHRIETDHNLVFTIGGEEYPSARDVMEALAEKNISYDGIFANQTQNAVECCNWIRENCAGEKNPVRVISFEDGILAESSEGGITALKLDHIDISRRAVAMLTERLKNREKETQVVRVAYKMTRRKSTGGEKVSD